MHLFRAKVAFLARNQPLQGEHSVSKPVHAVRVGGGPPGTNHCLFKDKPSSHHVNVTLCDLSTSPCPTLSADAEPAHKRQRLSFLCSAQCDVTKSAL